MSIENKPMQNYKIVNSYREKELEAIVGILKLKNQNENLENEISKKIKKTRFQIAVLKEIYKFSQFPYTASRKDLGLLLSIPHRSIQVWFQNTRQNSKKVNIPESLEIHINEHKKICSNQFSSKNSKDSSYYDDTGGEIISLGILVDIINSVKNRFK